MSNPYCCCSVLISTHGSTYHQCEGCKRGLDMKQIMVDNDTWPEIQRILNGERLPARDEEASDPRDALDFILGIAQGGGK